MEDELDRRIDNIESEYPGYDEYRCSVDEIGHNPYALISYLTAKYVSFTTAEMQSELETLFQEQYRLSVTESIEIRYRTEEQTVTTIDPETGKEITTTETVEVPYEYKTLSGDIEEKILSMYAKGMSTGDIEAHIRNIYGLSISDSTISRVTDKILPIVREWQQRPLESLYGVVFMDAIHFHVRSEGQIVKKAVYVAIGLDMEGKRDVLGMWIGENESAKFWLGILNSLKNRGVEDILIACVDGLTGFTNAIEAVYPRTEVQQCIIHQIRNTTRFVSYKDIKELMKDLKLVYGAVDESTALSELDAFDAKWSKKYPKIASSWREKWPNLATYFKYPQQVRKLIYTTNAIENFNRQLRKVTKAKSVFPTDDSLLKMLYLAMIDITKKWTGRRQDWGAVHSQLEIFFADRIPG